MIVRETFTKRRGVNYLRQHSPILKRCDDILGIAWYDKRPVHLMTSLDTSEMVNKRIRDRDAADGFREYEKPAAVQRYNLYMGGVDWYDQINSYCYVSHRSLKWWNKVFFHLYVTAITDSYIMYRNSTPVEERMHTGSHWQR